MAALRGSVRRSQAPDWRAERSAAGRSGSQIGPCVGNGSIRVGFVAVATLPVCSRIGTTVEANG